MNSLKNEALLKKVEDLEDILLVKESLDAPEEEVIGLEDYERQRTAAEVREPTRESRACSGE